MKAIEVLLGQELRTLCETAEKAAIDTSRIGDEIREKHSIIATKSLDSRVMSKIDTLLADIKHGRVTLSMELGDHDEQYAATHM